MKLVERAERIVKNIGTEERETIKTSLKGHAKAAMVVGTVAVGSEIIRSQTKKGLATIKEGWIEVTGEVANTAKGKGTGIKKIIKGTSKIVLTTAGVGIGTIAGSVLINITRGISQMESEELVREQKRFKHWETVELDEREMYRLEEDKDIFDL